MRNWILLVLLAILAGCQTVPRHPAGFTAAQAKVLEAEGFKQVDGNYELGISDRVLFAVDQSDLTAESAQVINRLAKIFASVGIHGATVQGHTDSTGSSEYNAGLSQRRATSVKVELVKAGMREGEVQTAGLGETRPIADNATEEGRAQNRRVVILISPADAAKP